MNDLVQKVNEDKNEQKEIVEEKLEPETIHKSFEKQNIDEAKTKANDVPTTQQDVKIDIRQDVQSITTEQSITSHLYKSHLWTSEEENTLMDLINQYRSQNTKVNWGVVSTKVQKPVEACIKKSHEIIKRQQKATEIVPIVQQALHNQRKQKMSIFDDGFINDVLASINFRNKSASWDELDLDLFEAIVNFCSKHSIRFTIDQLCLYYPNKAVASVDGLYDKYMQAEVMETASLLQFANKFKRAQKSPSKIVVGSSWSDEQIQQLKQYIQQNKQNGFVDWNGIGQFVKERSAQECMKKAEELMEELQ